MVPGQEGDEPIGPPLAADPKQLARLIADALGDGDLAAALSYYEPAAVVALPGHPPATGRVRVERAVARLVDARLAIELDVARVLGVDEIALVRADWVARGVDPAGVPFVLAGTVVSVARRGSDSGWRVAAEEIRTHH